MSSDAQTRGSFGKVGFILAAAGSAIGLGNIWKFPYVTYANEGGSFVLAYLAAVVLVGLPIMMAEIVIGRHTGLSPIGAFSKLGDGLRGGKRWALVGWLGCGAAFVILSYYSVVAGWTVYYIGQCLSWSFFGFGADEASQLGANFGAFISNGPIQILFHAIFMGLTMGVVGLGVGRGIERSTKFLMPALFVILILLSIRSIFTPGFGDAISFLFHIGPLTGGGLLEALGLAFFSLSLGLGVMITYGSYISRDYSIPKAAVIVVGLDTLIAFLASIIMFSIIFGVPEAERASTFSGSATILFTTLPRMFYELPGGAFLSPLFYLLVAFAALSSTISLLEVVVAYFVDSLGWARGKATAAVGFAIFLLGIPSALSLGASSVLTTMRPLGAAAEGFFGTFDYLASNWFLPLGGLSIAVFTAWVLPRSIVKDEIERGFGEYGWFFKTWMVLLRFLCPAAILWILLEVLQGRSFS